MTCQDIQQCLLTDFLDEQVSSGKKAEIDRHLAGCAACREFFAAVRKVNDPLREFAGREPGPHVWARIREQVEARPVSIGARIRGWFEEVLWGFRPTFVYGSLVAAMCVVLVLPAGLYGQRVMAAAEKEALVQLVYADDGASDLDAEMIGMGTLVEAWL